MSFDFIPRSVKKRKVENTSHPQVSTSAVSNPTSTGAFTASEKATSEIAKKASKVKDERENDLDHRVVEVVASSILHSSYNLEDLAILIWLALSDFALWSNSDLRHKIDLSVVPDDYAGGEDDQGVNTTERVEGYVPLSYLLKRSPIFLQASSSPTFVKPPETVLVRAIRTHTPNLLNIRMIVPDDASSSQWSNKTLSGYEVKRINKSETISNYRKVDWDGLTIYVENLPSSHRSLSSIAKFISCLLNSSQIEYTNVQNISFPPHHNDQPGSYPFCKGFALVTLSNKSDVQRLLDEWSWVILEEKGKIERSSDEACGSGSQSSYKLYAQRSGFRCISKARWEELKEEYLAYRQQLIDELEVDGEGQRRQPTQIAPTANITIQPKIETYEAKVQALPETSNQPQAEPIHVGSSFPSGCLVFVRHVHPQTNKTTLRALFSQAWNAHNSQTAAGLDYLDYSKGLDTCYIRLSSPSHAEHFVDYFTTNPTTQLSGLDGSGTLDGNATTSPLIPELVLGKREELYWQKVPEKIRRQAVEKALKLINDVGGLPEKEEDWSTRGERVQGGSGNGKRRRKR